MSGPIVFGLCVVLGTVLAYGFGFILDRYEEDV